MPNLSCKTRGNSSPQGKARDYEKAAKWYLKAALQGHPRAKQYLKKAVYGKIS